MSINDNVADVANHLAAAEASAWLVRLQDSTAATDKAAFQDWLSADPAHARAFARVNDIWDQIPGAIAPVADAPRAFPRRMRPRPRHRWVAAVACAALLLVAIGVGRNWLQPGETIYATAIGQQKTLTLDDGTHITLNTDTRIAVDYQRNERRVRLLHGEALFKVEENPQRPFVLHAGGQQIVDLGTTFDVSHYTGGVAVTLLEGKVWVAALDVPKGQPAASTVLQPGERLTVQADGQRAVDRPDVADVTAWQHGRVYFNATSLADAAAELDRYGGTRIDAGDPALAGIRISGVFSTHDPAQFAAAVADLHGLRIEHRHGAIVLVR